MEFWHLVNQMKKNNKEFLLYGFLEAENVLFVIENLEIKIKGCVDDDPFIYKKTSRYGEILSFLDLTKSGVQANYNYIIGIDYAISIRNRLLEAGVPQNQILWLNTGKLGNCWVNNPTFMVDHYNEFKENLAIFSDEKSQMQYWGMCCFRMDFNEARLEQLNINAYNQYFDEIVCLTQDEVFVDIGAYDGKTIQKFMSYVKGQYKKIFAIEASTRNMQLMKARLKEYSHIEYLQYAVLDTDIGGVSLNGDCGANSKIDLRTGDIPTNSLDNLINEKVTFIKMDIEGAEMKALEGMKGIIKQYRPKLAISIYHSSEDMLLIPQLLKRLCENYDFNFRQHAEGIGESICYAIPKEL